METVTHDIIRMLALLAAIPATLAIVAVLGYVEDWYRRNIKPWG